MTVGLNSGKALLPTPNACIGHLWCCWEAFGVGTDKEMSRIDRILSAPFQVDLCLECIEWAKSEKRTFLRQALEVGATSQTCAAAASPWHI